MKRRDVLIVFVIVLILLVSFIVYYNYFGFHDEENDALNGENYCTQDADCVPASCCHPASCVSKDKKPDCSGIMCTMSCEPDTLDCGQGSCLCVKNKCSAIIPWKERLLFYSLWLY